MQQSNDPTISQQNYKTTNGGAAGASAPLGDAPAAADLHRQPEAPTFMTTDVETHEYHDYMY